MRATDMLVCGEDLGFLAPCVHPLMKALGLVGRSQPVVISYKKHDQLSRPTCSFFTCMSLVCLQFGCTRLEQSGPSGGPEILQHHMLSADNSYALPSGRPADSAHALRARHRVWRPGKLPIHVRGIPILP